MFTPFYKYFGMTTVLSIILATNCYNFMTA
jgi:hypothetical protein